MPRINPYTVNNLFPDEPKVEVKKVEESIREIDLRALAVAVGAKYNPVFDQQLQAAALILKPYVDSLDVLPKNLFKEVVHGQAPSIVDLKLLTAIAEEYDTPDDGQYEEAIRLFKLGLYKQAFKTCPKENRKFFVQYNKFWEKLERLDLVRFALGDESALIAIVDHYINSEAIEDLKMVENLLKQAFQRTPEADRKDFALRTDIWRKMITVADKLPREKAFPLIAFAADNALLVGNVHEALKYYLKALEAGLDSKHIPIADIMNCLPEYDEDALALLQRIYDFLKCGKRAKFEWGLYNYKGSSDLKTQEIGFMAISKAAADGYVKAIETVASESINNPAFINVTNAVYWYSLLSKHAGEQGAWALGNLAKIQIRHLHGLKPNFVKAASYFKQGYFKCPTQYKKRYEQDFQLVNKLNYIIKELQTGKHAAYAQDIQKFINKYLHVNENQPPAIII